MTMKAVLFPLTVAAFNNKAGDAHRVAANQLLTQLRGTNAELLAQV